MEKIYKGVPRATYFEIFSGEHYSRKLFSVQVKEFDQFCELHKGGQVADYTAVYAGNDLLSITNKQDHVKVELTQQLLDFMEMKYNRYIRQKEVYVKPCAFEWANIATNEDVDLPELDTDVEVEDENKSNKKVLLALAVAAISLLS